jgi:hypothetical protein
VLVRLAQKQADLKQMIGQDPRGSLVFCVSTDSTLLTYDDAVRFEKQGVAMISGALTASGKEWGDRATLYEELFNLRGDFSLVAPYTTVYAEENNPRGIAEAILQAATICASEWKTTRFYVKNRRRLRWDLPGRFRLSLVSDGVLLPDLSLLSGDATDSSHAAFINFERWRERHFSELAWLFIQYEKIPTARVRYLSLDLPHLRRRYDHASNYEALRKHSQRAQNRLARFEQYFTISTADAIRRLTMAIKKYQDTVGEAYQPILCQQAVTDNWTLCLRLRSAGSNVVIESAWIRIKPMALLEDGPAYLDSYDRSTTELDAHDPFRIRPLSRIFVNEDSTKKKLFHCFDQAMLAFQHLRESLPEARRFMPQRFTFELSLQDGIILDIQGDEEPGISIHTRWEAFVRNTEAWLNDGLLYYVHLNGGSVEPVIDIVL